VAAAHPETTTPDQDLASTITVASTITGHRKGPFPHLLPPLPIAPKPPHKERWKFGGAVKSTEEGLSPRAQEPSPLCYTSACIKSRVRDWPFDRDGNLA